MPLNFGKLAKSKATGLPQKLEDLFFLLDRKATHEGLRQPQREALAALDAQIDQHDIVLKLGTGSGKTIVALVYLEYMRRRYAGEPILYVCPTRQLVEQVIQTGTAVGVGTATFPVEALPYEALAGKAILVCTYDKLFNARNIFEKNGIRPAAIVLDDVHAGVDRVRQSYSAVVPDAILNEIRKVFAPLCEKSDPGSWRAIHNNETHARVEVPFWVFQEQAQHLADIMDQQKDADELRFTWGNVQPYSDQGRLCISGASAELTFHVTPSEENQSYSAAKHRLFMSASIKDGAALIRDLNCDANALERVIEPASDRGIGERMILPISLIHPGVAKEDIAELCAGWVPATNVVVLTSSLDRAKPWIEAGATLKQSKDIDEAITELRGNAEGNYLVFAQRYDGVDLPDDACRVLVIDGLPVGERLSDKVDAERQSSAPGHSLRAINRFEQALGRAVRSSADYAAVLLVGSDIAAFIGRHDVKKMLDANSREQIELGRDMAEQLKDSEDPLDGVDNAIVALVNRNEGWKEAHRARLAGLAREMRQPQMLTQGERNAVAERGASIAAKARNFQAAASLIQDAANEPGLHAVEKAELLYRLAGYTRRFDAGSALAIHRRAFELNTLLPRPIELPDKKYARVGEQAINVRNVLQAFTSPNAAVARMEEIRSKLAFAGNAELVERGLLELGEMLGLTSSRPEKETGRGPDVLWLVADRAFCIEAKSEKGAPIFKGDAEQLLLSRQWCVDQLGISAENIAAVFVTNTVKVDRVEDITFGPLFLVEFEIMNIIDELKTLVGGLSFDGPLFNDPVKINSLLNERRLTLHGLLARLQRIA